MNKIILSLSMIAFVAAIAIVGTTAYFSDVEKSSGNTFTAGELDLKIDSTCHYNGAECICAQSGTHEGECYWDKEGNGVFGNGEVHPDNRCYCTWAAKDLDGERFFDYDDIKPGDWGENTLSFHVIDNDAWGRVIFTAIENRENGCNEPERSGPTADPTCIGRWCGELAQNMYTFIWVDNGVDGQHGTKGDNIYQDGEKVVTLYDCANGVIGPNDLMYCPILPDGAAGIACQWSLGPDGTPQGDLPNDWQTMTIPVVEGIFLEGCVTNYLGVAWYVPTSVDNIIQGDSIKADVSFEIEQARHNDNPFDN